jgi:large subunit ribosomal protein L24
MRTKFSNKWKASKQPRKQRKYVYNAPLHTRNKFMAAHLSEELMKKYKRRNFPVKKGDSVMIMRGQFKGKTGNINSVNYKKIKVYVDGAEMLKKDGTKAFYPIHPSNLMIKELDLKDKERKKAIERSLLEKKPSGKK